MHHTIDICQDIAEKLRSPEALYETIEDERRRGTSFVEHWPDLSLASGLPGIVCFYAAMDRAFPDQHWDDVAHQYIKLLGSECERRGYGGYSLFTGISGLCFAGYLCAKDSRYTNFLRQLDVALVQEVEKGIAYIQKQCVEPDRYVAPHHYSLMYGLSGVVAYLMLRQQDRQLQKLMGDCVDMLISMLTAKKSVAGTMVPGWFVSPEHQFDKEQYPHGSYFLSTQFGITGCLSILSLVAWHGKGSAQLSKAIKEIASWLCQKQVETPFGHSWPEILPIETDINKQKWPQSHYGDDWKSGRPSAAISLYMAGRAMQDKDMMTFAEERFASLFHETDASLQAPSFSFGQAGLLASTYRMAKLTNSSFLMRQVSVLESSLKKLYSPSYRFGFQRVRKIDEIEFPWNDPGLLDGAVGAALALLSADGRLEDFAWDRAFLLT